MRKFLFLCGGILCLAFIAVTPSLAGPCSQQSEAPGIFIPDRGCAEFGVGYQYQHYNVFGRTFNTNGYNVNLGLHLFDWLTGADGRLTVSAEGAVTFGFGGRTSGTPQLEAKSLFVGGGPHIAIETRSRLEPWAHVLAGWQHFRFTQTFDLGSNSAFGFMAGGGLDFRLGRQVYWRLQGDYIGTRFQSSEQSNYSFGSGLIFYF